MRRAARAAEYEKYLSLLALKTATPIRAFTGLADGLFYDEDRVRNHARRYDP